jgi:hypothetical protein
MVRPPRPKSGHTACSPSSPPQRGPGGQWVLFDEDRKWAGQSAAVGSTNADYPDNAWNVNFNDGNVNNNDKSNNNYVRCVRGGA